MQIEKRRRGVKRKGFKAIIGISDFYGLEQAHDNGTRLCYSQLVSHKFKKFVIVIRLEIFIIDM